MSSLWRANRLIVVCTCLLAFGLALGGCTEESGQSGPITPADADVDDATTSPDAGVDASDAAVDTTADATTDSGDPDDTGDSGEPGDVDLQDTGDSGEPGDSGDPGDSGEPADAEDTGGGDAGDAATGDADGGTDTGVDTGPAPTCTDVSDCNPRANTSVDCVSGSCEYTCDDGYDSCDSDPSTGCETDIESDLDHCGACGDVCAPANATGMCTQGVCDTDCDDGFVDLNGDAADGCECEITDPDDAPDQNGTDSNCDGIDGDASASIFVSAQSGDDSNDGLSSQTPVATISRGIELAFQEDPSFDVLVAEGTYDEYVTLEAGVDVYGGYSESDWSRDPSQYVVAIQPSTDSGDPVQNRTVVADGLDADTTLDSVDVYGADSQEPGASTYAVWVGASADHLTISHSNITAGEAAAGADGVNGQPVAGGANGQNAQGSTGAPTNDTGCTTGGAGGNPTPACDETTGEAGDDGGTTATDPGGVGGDGGDNFCRTGLQACQNTAALDGEIGEDGEDGENGQPGSDGYGFFSNNYVWNADAGAAASGGDSGSGGGGGGAGGSCSGSFANLNNGGGGGAGGSGGCGGEAGENGHPGGGSFGLLLVDSSVTLEMVDIAMSVGGDGGDGGNGSTGRAGGLGGLGDPSAAGNGEAGGDGGDGGHGGDAGNGAGGCGGPSIGIATADGGQVAGTNYTVDTSNAAAGSAGSGGVNAVGSAAQGCQGEVADEHAF